MASSQLAHSDVTSGAQPLFDNLSFWLSATVPQRSRFTEQIQANGGRVVKFEKDANYRLVDHTKKDLPHGTYSYQFVERSIRKGKLQDPEEYRAGPSTTSARPVGSTATRPKGTRRAFTAKDDQILYDWVKIYQDGGKRCKGNLPFQDLEAKYPHHTYQSWRDRYVKYVQHRPRPVTKEDDTCNPPQDDVRGRTEPTTTRNISESFTETEKDKLLRIANHILQVEPSLENEAWVEFAKANTEHGANEWRKYFHASVAPEYMARDGQRKSSISTNKDSPPKSRNMATSESTNAVSKDGQAAQPESSQRTLQSRPADNKADVVYSQRNGEKPSEQPNDTTDMSLKRKRRETADEACDSSGKNTASPTRANKRLATDDVQKGNNSVSRSSQAGVRKSNNSSGQSEAPQRVRFSGRPPKSSPLGHANNASKEPTSNTDSEEDQFETAPQFQSSQHPHGVQTRENDDLTTLLDTSLPQFPGHDADEAEEDENDAEVFQQLEGWINDRAPSGEAADMMPVIEALRCTTMDSTLADKVLPYLKTGKGVPKNMRGIWTAEDDERLEGENARDIAEVHKKHGEDLAQARLEYLAQRREPDP